MQDASPAEEQLFDLDSITDLTEREVQIKRGEQPLPIYVTLAGPEHAKRKALVFAKQRAARAKFSKTGKLELPDPADEEQDEADLIASCVLAWRGVAIKGKPIECTKANVLAVLNDPARAWFRRAVKAAFDDTEAFTVASASA